MRLNRFLASAGLGSRRGVEELIRGGFVTVNGQVCTELATQIGEKDAVKANGHLVRPEKQLYILLNKPAGYVCTASDPEERTTVFDLLPRGWPRLFHVGRLDKESEGLLLLTNDGELSMRLTHPRYKIEKEYEVVLDRPFDMELKPKLLKGMHIGGAEEGSGWAKAESVHRMTPHRLKIILRQGLKRQIRLMLHAIGYEVTKLVRVGFGPLRLEDMRPGEWRALTAAEVALLKGEKEKPPRPGARNAPRPEKTAGNVPE
jgi:23S rRNA pseudouridine2605 synthase